MGALLLALLFVSSCASTEPLERRIIPFHVAIVPMERPIVGEVSPGELPGDETDLHLDLDCQELTASLSAALGKYCFSRVTVLEHRDGNETVDPLERQRLLMEAALEAEADLLVEFHLRYDLGIYRENAGTFWLNFPLFLIASPSNWFVDDVGYYADVELTTSVYDVNTMEASGLALGDPAARVISASSRYTGEELNFIERADGLGSYALSILVPSGFLARGSDDTLEEIHAHVIEEIRSQVVQGIQGRREDLLGTEWIAPFIIDPDELLLTRSGDELLVRGNVRMLGSGSTERVQALSLHAGGESVTVRPEFAGPDGVTLFEARVPMTATAAALRLECMVGSRDSFVRSYTFDIPGR